MITLSSYFMQRSDGSRKEFDGFDGVWISDVAGLGAETAAEYADLGYGFFSVTDNEKHVKQSITCSIVFTGKYRADNYKAFMDWMFGAPALYFGYRPDGKWGEEYTRPVALKMVSKSERVESGIVIAAVSFECLAPWTREITLESKFNGGIPVWGWELKPMGHQPSAIRLSYKAAAERQISLVRLSYLMGEDAVYKEIVFPEPLQLAAGEELRVSTAPNDYYIRHIDADGEASSVMDKIIVGADPVLLLPPDASDMLFGEDALPAVVIRCGSADAVADTVSCTQLVYYRTV